MIVLGVDPSSSVSGLTLLDADPLLDDPKILSSEIFDAGKAFSGKERKYRETERLQKQLVRWSEKLKEFWTVLEPVPELVIVEKVSVSWNVDTIRKIAYFEAIALEIAQRNKTRVIQVQVSKARKISLGSGKLDKDACYDMVKDLYPWRWLPKSKGGTDQTDAFVLALAGTALANEIEQLTQEGKA